MTINFRFGNSYTISKTAELLQEGIMEGGEKQGNHDVMEKKKMKKKSKNISSMSKNTHTKNILNTQMNIDKTSLQHVRMKIKIYGPTYE